VVPIDLISPELEVATSVFIAVSVFHWAWPKKPKSKKAKINGIFFMVFVLKSKVKQSKYNK
jgi:hypothetical protein